ncbi:M4 family metallopeptidase [Chryseobacterium koreense]|uniref:M4 family metallopeptidase n=1 Tax=Chryseobacterium koreense TaxID=232216 RepID=UPI0026F24946|nr:M4 family metallopeptidase [Chryseobacterium koreense]
MKKQLFTLGIVGFLMGFNTQLSAQQFVEKQINNEDGTPSLVIFKANAGLTTSYTKTLLNEILNLKPSQELKLIKSEKDFTGKFTDEKYQLYFKNIKVEGGIYNVHYKNGNLISMNGEIYHSDAAPSSPEISASSAFSLAVKSVGAQKYMWEDADYVAHNEYKKPAGELVYLPMLQEDGKYNLMLVYKFNIYAASPISRDHIYVDAMTGRIAAVDPIMKHANQLQTKHNDAPIVVEPFENAIKNSAALVLGTAATRYSGTQNIETTLSGSNYILHDTTRGNGVRTYNMKKSTVLSNGVDFIDNDNNWTAAEFDNTAFDNAALDAHWGVEKTYDYFKDTFSRNSYDNNGTLLRSYVHYSSAYENAGWTGSEMIYGDGASTFRPLTALDVTGHELGHGVCSSSANLLYQRESGALNEALSDIWGAAVEYTYAPSKQRWLIGEDIVKAAPQYLRSMSNPKSGLTPQPDTYRGINWYPATAAEGCATPSSSTNDNCGVHRNSGVINHWFYILSEGKTGVNDLGKSYSVTGITMEKAAKIAYRMETAYLGANSDFMAARNFGIQAAKDLYGADTPEAIATQDAFYAVGLGAKYLAIPDTTAPTVPTNLSASNTTGTQTKLSWNASFDENDIEKYSIYKDNVLLGSVTGSKTTYQVTGLTPNTTYNFFVKAEDPYLNVSAASNTVAVTTLNVPNYCSVNSSSTADERIKRVQFGTIDNTSTGTDGYEDFSYISTDVTKGQAYTITITPEWTGTSYGEAYAVFIDWNNNGVFTDAGETAWTKSSSTTSPVSGSINIPLTANTGSVRMRVIMRYSTTPTTACGTISYGQIEDYTLNLKAPQLAVSESNASKILIFPNPVKDILTIQSKEIREWSYRIFNAAGQLTGKGISVDKKINTEKLAPGNYVIELTDKDGNTSSSKFIKL